MKKSKSRRRREVNVLAALNHVRMAIITSAADHSVHRYCSQRIFTPYFFDVVTKSMNTNEQNVRRENEGRDVNQAASKAASEALLVLPREDATVVRASTTAFDTGRQLLLVQRSCRTRQHRHLVFWRGG